MAFIETSTRAFMFLATTLVFCMAVTHHAAASQQDPIFDLSFLKGIDTIAVSGIISDPSSGTDLFPQLSTRIRDEHGQRVPSPFLVAVREVFSKTPWVSVESIDDVGKRTSNVIIFTFGISARQEIFDGKTVKIAALSLQLWKRDEKLYPAPHYFAIPHGSVAYLFLIPDTEEELHKRIAEGVRYLTAHLPSYFICANNRGDCILETPIYGINTRRPPSCPPGERASFPCR